MCLLVALRDRRKWGLLIEIERSFKEVKKRT